MKITNKEYEEMTKKASPKSKVLKDCTWEFFVGGGICLVGEILRKVYLLYGFTLSDAAALASITLVGASAIATSFGWYQKLATHAGAGTLVPITGFANAVVSPAIEFKCEGFITGTGAKMFIIAGPVIVWGMTASILWGIIYYFLRPMLGG